MLLYICEAPANKLHYLVVDDRTHEYGLDIKNLEEIPRGPYFIKQPVDIVFDLTKRKITNDVYLRFVPINLLTDFYKKIIVTLSHNGILCSNFNRNNFYVLKWLYILTTKR